MKWCVVAPTSGGGLPQGASLRRFIQPHESIRFRKAKPMSAHAKLGSFNSQFLILSRKQGWPNGAVFTKCLHLPCTIAWISQTMLKLKRKSMGRALPPFQRLLIKPLGLKWILNDQFDQDPCIRKFIAQRRVLFNLE